MQQTLSKKVNNISVVNEECTGCMACLNICPSGAIEFKKDSYGFLSPVIYAEKCTNCGLCKKTCPAINPGSNNNMPDAYAAMASDDIRIKSSSGGIFTVLSEYIIENNGYVCGAAFDDNMQVKHIITDNKEGLIKLRGSKYVQSYTGEIYKEIKSLLKKNRPVLFSGTPCQISALKLYLGGDKFENLYLVDILCHGVPSPDIFEKFINENYLKTDIAGIDFRDKTQKGWCVHTVTTTFKDKHKDTNSDFIDAFLSDLCTRKCCGTCKFATMPRQGDITLGDFWGVEKFDKTLNDNKGTSAVLINNKKGLELFNKVKNNLITCKKMPLDCVVGGNVTLKEPIKLNKDSERFFLLSKNRTIKETLNYIKNKKYDIGVAGCGWSGNYGAILTNYAVHEILKNMGYSVLMIDKPKCLFGDNRFYDYMYSETDNPARQFMNKYYNLSKVYNDTKDLRQLNDICDTFLVPSDQVWNNLYFNKDNGSGNFFHLDFVQDTKRKISYAASFGFDYWYGGMESSKDAGYFLKKFDFISVRENTGVKILKETFGIEGTHVLDPIFCLDFDKYKQLSEKSALNLENKKYIVCYLLEGSEFMRNAILKISKLLNMECITILRFEDSQKHKKILNLDNVLCDISAEDFLNYIKNAQFVITTSFHAVCFSIIFGKKFACFPNVANGSTRFHSLLGLLNIKDRMLYNLDDMDNFNYTQDIDYKNAYEILNKEKEASLNWLKNALETPLNKQASDYDMCTKKIDEFENRLKYILNYKIYKKKYRKYRLLTNFTFGKLKKKFYNKKVYYKALYDKARKYL